MKTDRGHRHQINHHHHRIVESGCHVVVRIALDEVRVGCADGEVENVIDEKGQDQTAAQRMLREAQVETCGLRPPAYATGLASTRRAASCTAATTCRMSARSKIRRASQSAPPVPWRNALYALILVGP